MAIDFRKHWRTYLGGFVAVSAVVFVGDHFLVQGSDAFETASAFLQKHSEVTRAAGVVRETSLSWTGAAIEVSGNSGSAQLTINIAGSTSSPQAYVELKKRGIWEVTFARLLPVAGNSVVLKEGPP